MRYIEVPKCFYRVSVKGLCVGHGAVLLLRESDELGGKWELPGGGLEHGEDPAKCIQREVEEETGLKVTSVSRQPTYVWSSELTKRDSDVKIPTIILAYTIEVESLHFTPTAECKEMKRFSNTELDDIELHDQSAPLSGIFDPRDFAT